VSTHDIYHDLGEVVVHRSHLKLKAENAEWIELYNMGGDRRGKELVRYGQAVYVLVRVVVG
jgi:hypothetical protein